MRTDTDELQCARRCIDALRVSLQAGEREPVRLIETHISWVLLAGSLAYKLKKPIRLPFLDFSTLALRRHFCEEELRLNQRLAPSVYLGVVEVRDGPDGPQFGGEGPVSDVAVRMRRFPDGALWSEMLATGRLTAAHIDAMAERLAGFHRAAAIAPPGSAFGSAASHARALQGLVEAIDAEPDASSVPAWPALRAWLLAQPPLLAPIWGARLNAGRVRECHGDLHLANVLQLDGQPAAFDGIEFDPALRWIDVLDDIAFLAMDLMANHARAFAFRFINAYLQATGDHDGLPALRYDMVCRAVVRARVVAMAASQGTHAAAHLPAATYMALASALATGADARLAITHGLPGSGKSLASQAMVEGAGAIGVRSDVERKRLFGLGALAPSHGVVPGGIYDAATTLRTYARLAEIARIALGAGWPVVVDAAFLRRSERALFAALAADGRVPFTIVDCRAESSVLRRRIEQRQAAGADPSEADAAVLERLTAADEPLEGAERAAAFVIDANEAVSPASLASQWLAAESSVRHRTDPQSRSVQGRLVGARRDPTSKGIPMTTPSTQSLVARSPVWFVTGCSTGFGLEIAKQAIEHGYRTVMTARNPAALQGYGATENVLVLPLDVTQADQVAAAIKAAEARFGGIDVLVNNAGIGYFAAIEEGEEAEVRKMFEVNVFGMSRMIQAALPGMRKRRTGCIVNLSSIGGLRAYPAIGFYNATKFAVEGLSEALWQEVEPLGIRVMLVEPSGFRTDWAGRSANESAHRIDDYVATAGAGRAMVRAVSGKQAGDPVRAAKAIVSAVASGSPPHHLLLGNDAFDGAMAKLEELRKDFSAGEAVARAADFPKA